MGFKKENESGLVCAVLQWLNLRGVEAWRVNSGAMKSEYKGKQRFIRFSSRPGMSDIVGLLPTGRFLAVECKREGNKATPDQQQFLEMVNASGGLGILAYSLDDVMRAVEGALTQPTRSE